MSILGTILRDFLVDVRLNPRSRVLKRYAKLHEFIDKRINEDLYPEYPDGGHKRVTEEALKRIDAKWGLRGKHVLDVGCGQGIALEMFAQYGAIAKGLTFGQDFEECKQKGFDVYKMDMSFLEFPDETFDLIWARHSLEHSLFPYFTLHVLFAVLKRGGLLYAEVPAPDTSANHQLNKNHYSCLTRSSWTSLFKRVGFEIAESFDIHMQLMCGPDTWYSFYLEKSRATA
jgi:SAM-dependent methyltransferase